VTQGFQDVAFSMRKFKPYGLSQQHIIYPLDNYYFSGIPEKCKHYLEGGVSSPVKPIGCNVSPHAAILDGQIYC